MMYDQGGPWKVGVKDRLAGLVSGGRASTGAGMGNDRPGARGGFDSEVTE